MPARTSSSSRPTRTRPATVGRAVRAVAEALERRVMLDGVIPVGPEFRVNTYTTSSQSAPSIAMDADGDFVVAWSSAAQDGSGSGVYAQRFTAVGAPQGPEFLVNNWTTGDQTSPSLAMDAASRFVIAWTSSGQDGSESGVYARLFNASGAPIADEFRVNTWTTGSQRDPSVAMDDSGRFVIVWTSAGQDGSFNGVYAQRFDAAGAPIGGEFRVNTYTTGTQDDSSAAMDADGDFVIAWTSSDQSRVWVQVQRFSAAGTPQGAEFSITGGFTTQGASVAMHSDGDFVIAWTASYGGFPLPNFFALAQIYDSTGAPKGGVFGSNGGLSSAGIDDLGHVVLTYGRGVPFIPGSVDVYAVRYDAGGLGDEFRVSNVEHGDQDYSAVAIDADGDFVVAWQGRYQDGSDYGIYAKRYAVVPEIDSSGFLFDSSPHRLRFNFSRDVRDSLTVDDIAVQNITTGQTIPSNQFALLYDDDSNVATFMYLGQGSDAIGGVLPDGSYRATLLARGIVTPQGASLAEDHEFEFFFLNADANRDGRVTLPDFNILAANFGQSGTDFTRGDFTYDGTTDLEDLGILAGRFGNSLPPASGFSLFAIGGSLAGDLETDDWPDQLLM